jgi:hypothetical protein
MGGRQRMSWRKVKKDKEDGMKNEKIITNLYKVSTRRKEMFPISRMLLISAKLC